MTDLKDSINEDIKGDIYKGYFQCTDEELNRRVKKQNEKIYIPDYEAYLERKEKAKAKAEALWGILIVNVLFYSWLVWVVIG